MLDPVKTEQYLSELELIRSAKTSTAARMISLAKFFDRLVKSITSDEMVIFRNFYARFRYLLATIPMREPEQRNLENFRRLIKDGDRTNINDKALQQGILLLRYLLSLAEGKPALKEAEYREGYFTRLYPRRNYARLTDLKLLCYSWTEIAVHSGKSSFTLTAYDLEDLQGQVQIHVRAEDHYDYTAVRKLLKKDAVLHIQHLRYAGEGSNEYETTFDTLITLEPDFLVDATNIAECYSYNASSSELFFLNRLIGDLPGSAALKGTIVGYYLDEWVRDPTQDKDVLFAAAQRTHAMKAAQLGRVEMQNVQRSIYTEHLPNIRALVRRERERSKDDLWIEPTYFSTEYGLQGRLDLLCNNEATRTKDVIELKSGSPPNPSPGRMASPGHTMQVVCYDLMLESTYGKDRKGFNAVFYSRCQVSPYRNLVSEHREKRQVLDQRNEIVADIYRLAEKDFSVLERIRTEGVAGLPPFKVAALDLFRSAYAPGKITTEYYQEMMAFLLREYTNAKVGQQLKEDQDDQPNGFAGLWLDSMEEKLHDFRVIYDLQRVEIVEGQGYVYMNFDKKIEHAFRKGDLVILYPRTEGKYNALNHHILKGSLEEVHEGRLVVSLNNRQTNYKFIRDHDHWAVEPDIFERNYWSAISCLFNVLSASPRKKRILFGHEEPKFIHEEAYVNDDLTEIQLRAVQQALDAQDYYLLQGPPGTGKTSTFCVHYIREDLRRTKNCIVVLAFTNKAVDKICEAFKEPRSGEPIDYLRLGSRHVKDGSLLANRISDNNPDNWRRLIDGHRVFVSTVATFHNNWQLLRQFIPFDEVVVDEASQLTEAILSSVLAIFDKFVLIGDHKQLPAVITQDDALCTIKSDYLNKLGIDDLRKSLFERLVDNARSKGWMGAMDQLQDHYRMHEDIAALITRHYRDGLRAALPVQVSRDAVYVLPPGHFLQAFTGHRVVFVESPREGGLKRNDKEALMAATIANALVAEGVVTPRQIGIIAPFRAQVAAIKAHLRGQLLDNEDFIIDTVERYQGDERRIIIFSTTIGDPRQVGTIQSVSEDEVAMTDRKLLVSISRAIDQLIVLGNAAALKGSAIYRDLIGHIRGKGGYFEQFPLAEGGKL